MIVHFSILFLILLVSFFYEHKFNSNKIKVIADGGLASDYKGSIIPWAIVFGYLIILAGFRFGMNDTTAYINSFNNLNGSWNEIWNLILGQGKDKAFDITGNLFKMYISKDYHAWFLLFAIIESALFCNVLRRESISFFDTCFFLFSSTLYYNYFSMMRQWFAVAIVFWASRFIKTNKFIPYLLFCIIAAQFHNSAYFMIIIYFIVIGDSWNKKQLIILVAFVFALLLLNPLLGTIDSMFSDSTYNYVLDRMLSNTGSSWIRGLIAAVPVGLSFFYRKNKSKDSMYNICVNMSLINFMLNVLAIFTSGLFIIRMATYFSIFNLILYPYLLNFVIPEKDRKIVKPLFYFIYLAFYIYQMTYSSSWVYKSDVLTLLSNY